MKDTIKFKWKELPDSEAGFATYEVGLTEYFLRFLNIRAAQLVYTALSNAYREGYTDGFNGAKSAVQSALSKLTIGE